MRDTATIPERSLPALLAAAGWLFVASALAAQPVGTVRVADGLDSPSFVTAPRDDFNRLFILERVLDEVLIMDLTLGTIDPTPFLTVSADKQGLTGLAFHPRYEFNGYLYVYYLTDTPSTRTVVERYTRSAADPDLADPASALRIIEIPQPFDNHNGGWIGFGPDGYLYVPLGDGGSGCDPDGNGQDTTTLLGSVLRIDVDGDDFPADPNRNYAIPPDNPFVGQAGADEIWSYGMRNPFRASFDRQTGDLYMGDVGQGTREEIDYQPASSTGGENYGWDLREGSDATPDNGGCEGGPRPPGNVDPLYDYGHGTATNEGESVTGGYVYRGPDGAAPQLFGKYFFADFISERIWSIDAVTGANFTDWTTQFVPAEGTINQIVGFGEDGAGYLYIVDLGGEIFRVVGPFPFVPCPDFELSGDTEMGTEIYENCRNIHTGPAYEIAAGGDVTLRAGNRVRLGNGTTVAVDGELTIEIDEALQLTSP